MNAPAAGTERPNVLFISFDDMNHYVGFLGRHPDAVTPNLNRLAERSTVFERAYCQAPICNPSRASLMTGMRPSTTGVYDNRQPFRFSDVGWEAVTLPQHFQESGYLTTGSGKVYHGKFPDPMSWESYVPGPFSQSHPGPRMPRSSLNGMEGMGNVDWGALDVDDEEMSDYKAVTYCIDQLQQAHDRPFFLTCGLTTTHLTWCAPRKYFEMYDPDRIALPGVKEEDLEDVPALAREMTNRDVNTRIREEGRWGEAVGAYLACISFADAQIGRLLEALDGSAYARNTVVVLWGDHGWHLGEKLHWKKSTLWEEATRVPLLISAPGFSGGGCRKPVGLIDVYPTLAALCGLPERPELEGQSLVPLMEDGGREWERPALTTHRRGNHSLRFENWRYTRYRDGTEELYDHRLDEMEWTNLANNPACAEVKQELSRWLPGRDAPDCEWVVWPEENDAYRARIEALMQ